MSRCSSAASPASASFTTSTMIATARLTPIPPRWRCASRRHPTPPASALTLLPSFYAHGTFGGAAPHAGQRRFICSVDQFATLMAASREAIRTLPGANIGIAPHSLRAVAPDELAAIIPLAGADPIHIHAAEQVREVEDCLAWSGQRPVDGCSNTRPSTSAGASIHATHMTEQEVAALAGSGAVAGLCPVTEASLGDGILRGARIPRRGRPVRRRHRSQRAGRRSPTNCASSNTASG